MAENDDTTSRLVKNERCGDWLALVVVMVLATTLFLDNETRRALLTGLAVALVFAVTWLGQKAARRTRSNIGESRKAEMQDEWRLGALPRAYKWAFAAVLAALSAFCMTSAVTPIEISASMLAALVVALGATVLLGSFLLFDRA